MSATPIIKDLHFKLGGATDGNGRMIMGSGLLADGVRELPEVKAMVRNMYRESAGLPSKSEVSPNDGFSRAKNPIHHQAADAIRELNQASVKSRTPLIDAALQPDAKGNGAGRLPSSYFEELEARGIIPEGSWGRAVDLNENMDLPVSYLLDYRPARQGRSAQIDGRTVNNIKPIGWGLSNGRLYLTAMDINQLNININKAAKSSVAKQLKMSRNDIMNDIDAVADLHAKGKSTDDYFKRVAEESGQGKRWELRKKFINATQGLLTPDQADTNAMFNALGQNKKSGIYRTFAFDLLDNATRMTGTKVVDYGPNSYYTLKSNLMPQMPRVNRNGELVTEPTSKDVRFMPKKANPTRLAKDLASKYKVPLNRVSASGANGEITPNDIRAYIAERDTKFKPLSFQKEPPMAVDPTVSDLVGAPIEYNGMRGMIVDDSGRPSFQAEDGSVYELPFGYFNDQSIGQLGIKPSSDYKKTQNLVIELMDVNERPALQDIFGTFDKSADRVLEIAELGASKTGRGKNATAVANLPEFNTFLSKVSDEQILMAWEKAEQALIKAQNAKNLTDSTRQAIITKLEGDIRNIEAIASARENWKRKRIPGKVGGKQFKAQKGSISPADLTSIAATQEKAASSVRQSSQPRTTIQAPEAPMKQQSQNKNLASSISLLISGATSRQMEREAEKKR
jgi:hypothetical protein